MGLKLVFEMQKKDIPAGARFRVQGQHVLAASPVATPGTLTKPVKKLYRSTWERQYAEQLTLKRVAGLIRAWWYEPMRLKLANDAWFKVDFIVWENDASLSAIEVKGHQRESAVVRWKVARSLYPFLAFKMVSKGKDGGWETIRE